MHLRAPGTPCWPGFRPPKPEPPTAGEARFIEPVSDAVKREDIRLSTRVTAINLTGADRVTVVTEQGPLTAEAVIVTAPTTVLAAGEIAFRPAPPACQQAFADLPLGLVAKVGIAFTADVFGNLPVDTFVTPHQDTDRLGMGLAKLAGKPMMNLFVANDLARQLEAGGEAAFAAYATEFVPATGGAAAAAAIERTIVHPWGTDPLTRGSYSAARVGRVGKVAARAALAEPLDHRLYFAGEAVSTAAHSSLHGAYLTGRHAAASIAERLSASR